MSGYRVRLLPLSVSNRSAGGGVNNAPFDAAEVARRPGEGDRRAGVRAYEADTFERTVESAAGAAEAGATVLPHDDLAISPENTRSLRWRPSGVGH